MKVGTLLATLATALALPTVAGAETASMTSRSPTRVRGLASLGGGASTMFGVPVTGMHADVGVTIERGRLALPIRLDADLGRTRAGLGSNEITTGTAILWVHHRLRLGGGCDAGYGWLTRARASSTPSIGMFALDAFALASFDLVDLEDNRAIYLAVKPSVGHPLG